MAPFAPSSELVLPGLIFVIELYNALEPRLRKLLQSKSDRFLNYDPGFLLGSYAGEGPVANGITYTEICDFSQLVPYDKAWDDSSVVINIANEPFSRSNGKASWQTTSAAAFTALVQSGRISGNDSAIRVSAARMVRQRLRLDVQRARITIKPIPI